MLGRQYQAGPEFNARQLWLDFKDAVGTALEAIASGVMESRRRFDAWLKAFIMPAPCRKPQQKQMNLAFTKAEESLKVGDFIPSSSHPKTAKGRFSASGGE
jgi:hypothetical protein